MTYDLNDLTSWVSFSHRIINTDIFNGYPHQKAWYRMYLGTLLYTVSQLPKPRIFHLQWAIVRNVEKSYFLLLIWKGLYVYQLKNLMTLHNEVQHLVYSNCCSVVVWALSFEKADEVTSTNYEFLIYLLRCKHPDNCLTSWLSICVLKTGGVMVLICSRGNATPISVWGNILVFSRLDIGLYIGHLHTAG